MMSMHAISVSAISATAACVFAALLWDLSGWSFRIANPGQELFDLVEGAMTVAKTRAES
jgi:hypothetical protein